MINRREKYIFLREKELSVALRSQILCCKQACEMCVSQLTTLSCCTHPAVIDASLDSSFGSITQWEGETAGCCQFTKCVLLGKMDCKRLYTWD